MYLCSMFMCLFKLAIKCDSIRLLLWLPAARPINIEDPITICGIRGGPCLDQRAPSNQTQIKVSTAIGKMLKKPADLLNLIPNNICNVAKRESPTNWSDKPWLLWETLAQIQKTDPEKQNQFHAEEEEEAKPNSRCNILWERTLVVLFLVKSTAASRSSKTTPMHRSGWCW